MKKKILAVTGIRSEYDLMYPLLKKLDNCSEFELFLVVTGAHLTNLHNYSVNHIIDDGFNIVAKIKTPIQQDIPSQRVESCAIFMQQLCRVITELSPDLLLVLGDREEPLITAVAGGYLGVPIVHLAGGDSTLPDGGNVDEQARHATTKLSHIHLTMTESHSDRLLRLGEEAWRIHTVGSGGLDRLRITPNLSRDELRHRTNLSVTRPYVILIHHPLNDNPNQAIREINAARDVIKELNLHLIIGLPNSDPGSSKIIEHIRTLDGIETYSNLDRLDFVNLLRHSEMLMGNSSLAFHEADFLGLPAINIGQRQKSRDHGGQVIFCDGNIEAVRTAVNTVCFDETFRGKLQPNCGLYGDGYMADKAYRILRSLPDRTQLLAKHLTY